ncbi:chemotaxis protein CheW [Rheinheimera baltica]|uniref:Chemotaxis protein CheW n=1 Tax=Rheinheimera baltica TaxID=67576 RepID=A0ABT9HUU7_9GAMM|nr:chemotaxis protein CheW [Rheinheimera baltica]MDP5134893.1 chemotaxis protein CheW [Rheinheimera baltica]MDP5149855.1 chemotaxis protein CheW [Rheinheimera baltica]
MSNLIASQKVMKHYLSALLTEDAEADAVVQEEQKKQQLNALLAQAVVSAPEEKKVEVKPPVVLPTAVATETDALATLKAKFAAAEQSQHLQQRDVPVAERLTLAPPNETPKPSIAAVSPVEKDYRQGKFQALFFDVAGLKVAVPLKELGGIHQIAKINSLIGKPDWFKGVMLYREQKINIVDTARWVMPEKYDEDFQQKLNYQYVIMLGNSNWGLCCETLVNTFVLEQDDVKWREAEGKRPWMAGLIKKHMCVLLDVDAMIDLLNRGLDISA